MTTGDASTPITWAQLPALHDELRVKARYLLHQRSDVYSLASSDLIQLALMRQGREGQPLTEVRWEDRDAFFAAMYRAMWCVLCDHARKRKAKKRGGRRSRVEFFDELLVIADDPEQWVALERAFAKMEQEHPKWVRTLQHSVLSGLNEEEIARLEDVDVSAIQKRLRNARLWLQLQLEEEPGA